MADDKKSIPNAGKVDEPAKAENTEPIKAGPPEPEQPAPSKPEVPAVENAPAPGVEQPAPPKQDNPKGKDNLTPPKEDKPQPGKTDQQVTIPGMGDPTATGKVVDFTAARDGTLKGKPPEKTPTSDKGKQPDAPTPRRGRPEQQRNPYGHAKIFTHRQRPQVRFHQLRHPNRGRPTP